MKYPRNTVWYLETRPSGAPADAAQMGSGVVVRLYREGDLTSNRKYILTCSHVLRTKSRDQMDGYGRVLGEILCWRPGGSFLAPAKVSNRQSGQCPIAMTARIAANIRPLAEGEIAEADRRAAADWVLLDVDARAFQDTRSVSDLCAPTDGAALTIIGYPSGYRSWIEDGAVENHVSGEMPFAREALPGTIRIDGAYQTAPGMSGGGVFNTAGQLVGIHRSQTRAELALTAVEAGFIKAELAAIGWQLSPTPVNDLEGISEASRRVGEGVSELALMAGAAETRALMRQALTPLGPRFAELRSNLQAMQGCKECHEILLHRAGLKVGQCLSALKDWSANRSDVRLRFIALRELTGLRTDLLRFADVAPRCAAVFPAAVNAAGELRTAMDDVQAAVNESAAGAEQPIRLVVQQIVRTMPGQLQEALGSLARKLPFDEIAQALTQSAVDVSAPELRGLMELLPLQSNIRRLVNEHLAWQDLDRELRLLEPRVEALGAGSEDALADIAFMAKRVEGKVRILQTQETAISGVGELQSAAQQLREMSSVENPEIMAVLKWFFTVNSTANHLFAQADEQLLTACQRLGNITTPLEQLLIQLSS